jgi:hypothetical protein
MTAMSLNSLGREEEDNNWPIFYLGNGIMRPSGNGIMPTFLRFAVVADSVSSTEDRKDEEGEDEDEEDEELAIFCLNSARTWLFFGRLFLASFFHSSNKEGWSRTVSSLMVDGSAVSVVGNDNEDGFCSHDWSDLRCVGACNGGGISHSNVVKILRGIIEDDDEEGGSSNGCGNGRKGGLFVIVDEQCSFRHFSSSSSAMIESNSSILAFFLECVMSCELVGGFKQVTIKSGSRRVEEKKAVGGGKDDCGADRYFCQIILGNG